MEQDEANDTENAIQSTPHDMEKASPNLAVVHTSDEAGAMLALFDSLIAAPLQVSERKTHNPIYSDYLTSRIVAIEVGEEKTYHLHSSLLCQASQRFEKGLAGGFQEAKSLKINLDESPDIFSHFADFLYIPGWKPACNNGSDFIHLSELYAMGERLAAQTFQDAILRVFIDKIQAYSLETGELCRLLTVACRDITECQYPRDDPMRDHIFWLAALRLSSLQRSEEFQRVLCEQNELGKQLCLRAGSGTTTMPPNPFNNKHEELLTGAVREGSSPQTRRQDGDANVIFGREMSGFLENGPTTGRTQNKIVLNTSYKKKR
ncbi:hypothetical protein NA57DRAFT_61188 [Rhizodiscina lignyota]|uniref:BTB domain-containing protein n=1 Tax=Rhizodiscina lignyota TaxID=1504668 RepID=A0A9P4I8H0_9PEZI|nr:hypothetical protein NA57DRAFT_61188 [Rhizodiscina lignyota]